jgi:hypothetical protein
LGDADEFILWPRAGVGTIRSMAGAKTASASSFACFAIHGSCRLPVSTAFPSMVVRRKRIDLRAGASPFLTLRFSWLLPTAKLESLSSKEPVVNVINLSGLEGGLAPAESLKKHLTVPNCSPLSFHFLYFLSSANPDWQNPAMDHSRDSD